MKHLCLTCDKRGRPAHTTEYYGQGSGIAYPDTRSIETCRACACKAMSLLAEWAHCAVDCKMDKRCKKNSLPCSRWEQGLCKRSLRLLGIKEAK